MVHIKSSAAIAFAVILSILTSALTITSSRYLDQNVAPTRTFYNVGEKPNFQQKELGWTVVQTWDTCCMVVTLVGPEPGLYQTRDDKFHAGNTYFFPGQRSLPQAYATAMKIVAENRGFPAKLWDPEQVYWTQFTP